MRHWLDGEGRSIRVERHLTPCCATARANAISTTENLAICPRARQCAMRSRASAMFSFSFNRFENPGKRWAKRPSPLRVRFTRHSDCDYGPPIFRRVPPRVGLLNIVTPKHRPREVGRMTRLNWPCSASPFARIAASVAVFESKETTPGFRVFAESSRRRRTSAESARRGRCSDRRSIRPTAPRTH